MEIPEFSNMKYPNPSPYYKARTLPYFIALSVLAATLACRSEESRFTKIRITDLGFSFEVPNDWYQIDASNTQKLYQVLDLVMGAFEKPRMLLSLTSQKDIHSTRSNAISVQYQPDKSISQEQLAKSSQSGLDALVDAIKDNAVEGMEQMTTNRFAVSSRVTRERLVKRTSDTVFLGVELAVKMRADMPEKRKEMYYMFSDKGTVVFTFTYLASTSEKMSEVRDHVLDSFKLLDR